jgi:hypothetical protein
MKTRRLRFACWITRATDTHSECVIPNFLPLQQWLGERACMLHYTELSFHVSQCKKYYSFFLQNSGSKNPREVTSQLFLFPNTVLHADM